MSRTPGSNSNILSQTKDGLNRYKQKLKEALRTSSPQPAPQPPPSTSAPSPSRTRLSRIESVLRGLRRSADLCPPLQPAVDSLIACLDMIEVSAGNHRDYDELLSYLQAVKGLVEQHLQASRSEHITNQLVNIIQAIDEEIRSISEHRNRGAARRTLRASDEEADLIRRYHRIQQMISMLQVEISMNAQITADEHLVNTRLESMNPVKLARYNSKLSTKISRRSCTENTRKTILSELYQWSDDPDASPVFWMNGMAGTGKTTIAYTLAAVLESRGQLGASFFCTRASTECRDANRIVPTIAYQLSCRCTTFGFVLSRELGKPDNRDICSRDIPTQLLRLLKEPLLEVKDQIAKNLVVVVDALDECDDVKEAGVFLDTLIASAETLPIKFFLSSRPDLMDMHKRMPNYNGQHLRPLLQLHDVERSLVQADIELYLWEELASMSPAPDHVEQLAELAGNLFIYAATMVRYLRLDKRAVDPHECLTKMLVPDSQAKKMFTAIDVLYSTILVAALNDEDLEPEEAERIKMVLWTVVCAAEPITFETIAVLAGIDNDRMVFWAIQPLRSVLHVLESTSLVAPFHASFPEYLFNQDRSGQFSCNAVEYNYLLARRCFEIMKAQLRFNICNLESSFVFDKDVPGLQERIGKNISRPLSYACKYWGHHLAMTAISHELHGVLAEFLSYRLLFWLEVLNLTQHLSLGIEGLSKTEQWLWSHEQIFNQSSDLCELTSEVFSFAISLENSHVLLSTPHIYISALPLGPKLSPVSLGYMGRMRGLLHATRSTTVRDYDSWASIHFSFLDHREPFGGCLFLPDPTQRHTANVISAKFSPDGTRIVSGSYDNSTCVWDVQTRSLFFGPTKSGEGHSPVVSTQFSPDGGLIISSCMDGTIWVRDIYYGSLDTQAYNMNSDLSLGYDRCLSAQFSSDGTRIIGFSYRRIRVWDVQDGSLVVSLNSTHDSPILKADWSPDGTRIVVCYGDSTLCAWGAHDGTLLAGPLGKYTHMITAAAFSADGSRIVSGCIIGRSTFAIRNTHDGVLVAGPFTWNSCVRCIEFSLDGTQVVSGGSDCKIWVWDAHDGSLVAGPFEGHTGFVTSVGLSHDGTHIVSCSSYDGTIRVWDVRKDPLAILPSKQYTQRVSVTGLLIDDPHTASHSGSTAILGVQAADQIRTSAPHDWRIGSGGWVINHRSELLFCVLPHLRCHLARPSNPVTIGGTDTIDLDLSNALVGTQWHECYVD